MILPYLNGIIFSCNELEIPDSIQQAYEKLPEEVDFNNDIKPILSDKCFICHGPDKAKVMANLQLHLPDLALAELSGSSGKFAIKPGDINNSELIHRILSDDPDVVMPVPESHLNLTDFEKALLIKWIYQGAEYDEHWSYIKPERPELPIVNQIDWPQNPIDYFVLNKLEVLNKLPSNKANKEKLLRRVSFDLTGLPPSPEELDLFLEDDSVNAFEKTVDRLLASKTYGERLAIEWMELARYAETNGIHHDFERNAWPWRDWVIKAFNDNMKYNEFVTWQLAGDLFDEPTYENKLATAFNRNHRTTQECGAIDEEFRVSYVVDRTNTFGKAFLGLTLECAQCHDHKYDAISQKNYYELYAFFNQVPEKGVTRSFQGVPEPNLEMPKEQVKIVQEYIEKLIELEYANGSKQDKEEIYREVWREEMEAMTKPIMIMQDMDTIRPTYILDRGLYSSLGEEVQPNTPKLIKEFGQDYRPNRLGLSEWLFSSDNPLTARVAVNRYWQMIFGRGIVDTPDDFGSQGSLPTHPELLDWLAVEFMESGWNLKHLIKIIVMSATYQQASKTVTSSLDFDPDNKWLSRGGQQRLTAEMLRDQALKISGLLNTKVGGPSVKPHQPDGLWTEVSSGGRYQRKYMVGSGEDLYRRSLYTYWKRIAPPPAMLIFDADTRGVCNVKRQSTNTPLQALVLLNDPQFLNASKALAHKMIKNGTNSEQRISYGFRCGTSRKPNPREIEILKDLYLIEKNEFDNHPYRAYDLVSNNEIKNIDKFDVKELAAYTVIASTIINLSESLQKN
tara:strand:+ start:3828 stop:6197 length:2370 start_codon:yes stop_codon:yes gene_type:complete